MEPTQLTLFKEEPSQIARPLDLLPKAREQFVQGTQILSQMLQSECTQEEIALIHEFISKSEEDLEAFHEAARKRLLDYLVTKGEKVTDKGTLMLRLGEGRVQRAVPTNTKPDSKLTESTLRNRGLSPDAWMDRDVKYIVNEVKMKQLRAEGKLSDEDYAMCFKKVSYRIGKTQLLSEVDDE